MCSALQPNLVVHNGTVYDVYNAGGMNSFGKYAEESGLATLPLAQLPGIDHTTNASLWKRDWEANPVIPSGPPGSADSRQAADPKVFFDDEQRVWVMLYVCNGDGTGLHAGICAAYSRDLRRWDRDEYPLYRAGGHPMGIDTDHAHKISILYVNGTGYMFYTAVGPRGRGIALLTSKPVLAGGPLAGGS